MASARTTPPRAIARPLRLGSTEATSAQGTSTSSFLLRTTQIPQQRHQAPIGQLECAPLSPSMVEKLLYP